MTRTVARRSLTPLGLIRQRHGHKRKGKPVEAWKVDLEQDENSEDVRIRGVHLNAIEQIANGVEQMMFSWNLDTFERGQERAKIFNATNPDPLPSSSVRGDDEVHSSGPGKCFRNVGESEIHKLHNNLISHNSSDRHGFVGEPTFADTKQIVHPLQALPRSGDWITIGSEDDTNRSINVDGRATLEVPRNSGSTIRQNRKSGGNFSKGERDHVGSSRISTCEKKVGTEAENHQEQESTNKTAMTEFSSQLSFRELTSSMNGLTFLPTPPPQRNCYPEKENSCAYRFPGFSVAERQVQVSPRKEPIACHTSTLPHPLSNFPHSRSEADTRYLDKATYVDAVARAAVRTDSPTPYKSKSIRPNSGIFRHSSSCYSHRPTGTIETLEVGGRPVATPALWNGTEALKKKFESLINMTSGAPFIQVCFQFPACAGDGAAIFGTPEISSIEELQLALIECATEYEIKTLDARMKMQEMRAQKRQTNSCEFDQPASAHESCVDKMMPTYGGANMLQSQCALQHVEREAMRPEKMKENMHEPKPQPWTKKERSSPDFKESESGIRAFSRLFDKQRRSLDDALNHVDRLQKEVVKKDRELVEWQLKGEETKTQLYELEEKVKRTRVFQASPRLEPRTLLLSIPALRESLRSLKAEEQNKLMRSPLAETSQELSTSENKAMMSEMSGRDCSLDCRLQCLEERTFEMDELKATMSKLASNMAELSMAFKEHVQFVNHRLGAIHGFLTKRYMPASSHASLELVHPYVLNRNAAGHSKLAALETLEAEREITGSCI